MLSFGISGKTEVWHFDVEIWIKENVFRFDISMCDSFFLKILKDLNHLFGIESANLSRKTTKFSNILIKFTTICELQNDNRSFLFRLVVDFEVGLWFEIHHVDQKWKFQFFEAVGLKLKGLFFGDALEVNFESIELWIFAAEVDMSLPSFSYFSMEGILVGSPDDL